MPNFLLLTYSPQKQSPTNSEYIMSKIYDNLTELVGNTPLLEVKRIE